MSNETVPMEVSGVSNNPLSTPVVPQNSVSNDNSSNTESNDIHDIRDGVNNIVLNQPNSVNSEVHNLTNFTVNTEANNAVNSAVNPTAVNAVNGEVPIDSNQRNGLPIRNNRPAFRQNNTPYNDGMTRESRRKYCRERGIPFRQYCREHLLPNTMLPQTQANVTKPDKAPIRAQKAQPLRQPIQAHYPQLPHM